MALGSAASAELRIVEFAPPHVAGVAAAHANCFPGYFLTNLGADFLQMYYRACLTEGAGFGVVALDASGGVHGFAVGVPDLDHQDAALLRRHPLRVTWAVARAWVTDRQVRAQLAQRLRRMVRVVAGIVRHDIGAPDSAPVDVPFATLTSLAVLPGERRTGAASRLVSAFERVAARRGFGVVRASTSMDDAVAVAFYVGNGWRIESERPSERGVTFEKLLDVRDRR